MRLQKYLSAAGCCSRRQGEELITSGRVKVNGQVAALGVKIDPNSDSVELDGKIISMRSRRIYIALNKPKGYVTSCRQPGDKIVMTLINNASDRVYPVGRLDRESEGLLLLTNDGNLHHQLSHPSFDHEKEYEVTVADPISDEALEKLSAGVIIDGYVTRPAKVVRISEKNFRMTLQEGKKRQIRRVVGTVGNWVVKLKRVRISCVRLGKLPVGAWRYLTKEERTNLIGSPENRGLISCEIADPPAYESVKAGLKYTAPALLQKKKGLG